MHVREYPGRNRSGGYVVDDGLEWIAGDIPEIELPPDDSDVDDSSCNESIQDRIDPRCPLRCCRIVRVVNLRAQKDCHVKSHVVNFSRRLNELCNTLSVAIPRVRPAERKVIVTTSPMRIENGLLPIGAPSIEKPCESPLRVDTGSPWNKWKSGNRYAPGIPPPP